MQNSKIITEALKEFNSDKYDFSVTSTDDILFFRWDLTRLRDYNFESYTFSRLKKYYYVVVFFDNGTYIVKDVLIDKYQKNYKKAVLSKLSTKTQDNRLKEIGVMNDILKLRKPVDTFLSRRGYRNATQVKDNPVNIVVRKNRVLPEEADFSDRIVKLPIWFFGVMCVLMTLLGVLLFAKVM